MSVLDALRQKDQEDGTKVPGTLKEKLERGRRAMLKDGQEVKLNIKFWRGDQYWYLDNSGQLQFLPLSTNPMGRGGKPSHRIRQRFNFIHQIVEGKVSAATQRVPSYEIVPSTTEPQDVDAARLAEKVALYGYDKWRLRRAITEIVTNALVQREGFIFPYWDPDVGPYSDSGESGPQGMGEVRHQVLGATEVYWEPGVPFDDARWYAVEQAKYVGDVAAMDGFDDLPLTPDASTNDNPVKREGEKLVMVTDYLERPSKNRPNGRRVIIANDRVIVPPEDYPLKNHKDEALDEPCLVRLSYVVDPTQDRDRSLVSFLVDPQRTINDCWNKLLEWKNRALNPQMLAPVNSLVSPPDDVPGAVRYYRPTGPNAPQWEQPPRIPPELFQMLDTAISQMRIIAADVDVQADPNLAARTAQAAIEQSQARWASFLADLAECHSRVMRFDLYLVQRYYVEERLLSIEGMFGPDLIPGFKGADLCGQADVRVGVGSLESRSRTQVTQEAMAFADRGWIGGVEAMAAINGGIADNLYNSWELDVGRANRVMQAIRQNPDNFIELYPDQTREVPTLDGMGMPAMDPMGKPITQRVEVPWFMPRPGIDKTAVHKEVFSAWMKTTEWDRMSPVQREYGQMYYDALLSMEADEQMEQAQAQQAMAQQQGMGNASMPTKAPAMPSQVAADGPPVTAGQVLNS